MAKRTSSKRAAFGRLYVLGGFALVTSSRASGGDTDETNAPLKREHGSAKVAVVRDVGQKPLKGRTRSRREEADRQAIERGENEGMVVCPE